MHFQGLRPLITRELHAPVIAVCFRGPTPSWALEWSPDSWSGHNQVEVYVLIIPRAECATRSRRRTHYCKLLI